MRAFVTAQLSQDSTADNASANNYGVVHKTLSTSAICLHFGPLEAATRREAQGVERSYTEEKAGRHTGGLKYAAIPTPTQMHK